MWLVAMFDLPVKTRRERKAYAKFRTALLRRGFTMLQFSVYARYCSSEEAADVHRHHLHKILPEAGQVRLMTITDRQFGKMEVFCEKNHVAIEKPPEQLLLF